MRLPTLSLSLVLLTLPSALSSGGLLAQASKPLLGEARHAAFAKHLKMQAASPHRGLRWQFLGPTNISGRVTDVAVGTPRGKTYRIFIATASGGVWKTENDGTSFRPVFQNETSTSIGAIAIAPSDPKVVWIGTGEANIFRSSMAGCGVYKSLDGGETWQHMGLTDTHTIARIRIHPKNPKIVYVAASGHEWTDNEERGVYRSRDGGRTWKKVLFVSKRTGAIDLVLDPSAPKRIYASTWQRIRRRWNDPRVEEGYKESTIYRSDDGGSSWIEISKGLPAAKYRGRIGIDLCRSQPKTLYAFVDNYELDKEGPVRGFDSYGRPRKRAILGATVFRSDDRGNHWRQVSKHDRYMRRLAATYGWVFGQIRVDPVDPGRIYVMGLALNVSEDGGKSFRRLGGMHGDHHALWIDPANPKLLVNGNDGGANISYDGGRTWRLFVDRIPAVQFFNLQYDMAKPFHVYGSIQDHGSRRAVVDLSRGRNRIPAQDWEWAPGGEGSHHAIDPDDPNTVYSESFYGRIQRTDMKARRTVSIVPKAPKGEPPYRGQWLAHFLLSPHNGRIVYHGMNKLFRSLDRGNDFEAISGDLTLAGPSTLGDIPFHTITAIAESYQRFGELYVGTDDGLVHRSLDSGKEWQKITSGLREDRQVSRLVASRFVKGRLYLALNGKRNDDFSPLVYRSEDQGTHWTRIADGIPLGPVNVIREDPRNPAWIYVGTDVGVYISQDRGKSWHVLGTGLPSTFVSDLVIHPRDDILVVSTHGRGVYALDLAALRKSANGARKGKQKKSGR